MRISFVHTISSLGLLALTLSVSAQSEKIWLDNTLNSCKKKDATHYLEVSPDGNEYSLKMFDKDQKLKMVGTSVDPMGKTFEGYFEFFHPNGKLESKGEYLEDVKIGIWERFDSRGNRLAERTYAAFSPSKMAYTYVEEMPLYEGGNENFSDFLKLKLRPLVNNTEFADKPLSLELGFVVSEQGLIENLEFTRGLTPEWNETALEAIKAMPKWNPGKKSGENVRVWVRLPIDLSL